MSTLLWEANFSNMETLTKHWNIEVAPPRNNNNELQRYTNDTIKFENGELVLTMVKKDTAFKSGRINTKGKVEVQYGYIEGMLKFPSGKGLWPAFWLLGNGFAWPKCGEIDIMECVGWNEQAVY